MQSSERTGWVGWIYFASVMMYIIGGMEIITGLAALFKDDFYVATQNGLLAFNYTGWGWIHLLLGILIVAAAAAVTAPLIQPSRRHKLLASR